MGTLNKALSALEIVDAAIEYIVESQPEDPAISITELMTIRAELDSDGQQSVDIEKLKLELFPDIPRSYEAAQCCCGIDAVIGCGYKIIKETTQ